MYGNVTSHDSSSRSDGEGLSADYLQRFFLARLRQLVALRREQQPRLEDGGPELRLLDKAVYSTFCDCLDLGVGDEARAALKNEEVQSREHEAPEVGPN